MISRRNLLVGLGAALAAPAICKYEWIMPVRSIKVDPTLVTSVSEASGYLGLWVSDYENGGGWHVERWLRSDGNYEIVRTFYPRSPRRGETPATQRWTEISST